MSILPVLPFPTLQCKRARLLLAHASVVILWPVMFRQCETAVPQEGRSKRRRTRQSLFAKPRFWLSSSMRFFTVDISLGGFAQFQIPDGLRWIPSESLFRVAGRFADPGESVASETPTLRFSLLLGFWLARSLVT